MSVQADDSLKSYPGNGAAVIFDGPRLFDPAHLTVVQVVDATRVESSPAYTLTNVGINGPSRVTLSVATPVGSTLLLRRTMPYEQSADFTNQQTLLRRVVEATFDVAVMLIQQLAEGLSRSFRLGPNVTGVSVELPTPVPLAALVWNPTATALENGNTALVGDMLLRPNLASYGAGAGSDLVGFRDIFVVPYLQTVSNALNGLPVSLHRFIPPAQHAAIRAATSTYDCGNDVRTAFLDATVRSLYLPNGRHNYSGNLPRTGGLSIRGESSRHSILRCVGAGGIVFSGGGLADAFTYPVLDLADLRILATVVNAGTAVTMNYTAGSGIPALGPRWNGVAIEAEAHGAAFNIGVRGTNVRDFRIESVTVAGSNGNPGYPANYLMDHGFLMDGDSDPVELWFRDLYSYYIKQAIEIQGTYEGIYIDHAHTVAAHHFLKWVASVPNPVAMVSDSYIATERSGVDLDLVSYFRLQDSVYNPTAPTPDADYTSILIRRSSLDQTQASEITGNTFIGVGYSSRTPPFTETAIHLVNANTVAVNNNTVFDMDVGIKGTAGSGNRIGPNNRYIAVTTNEDVPIAMRAGHLSPECVVKVSRNLNQSVTTNLDTVILFDTELRDDRNYYNPATGGCTPPSGHYKVRARLRVNDAVVNDTLLIYIKVGGVNVHASGLIAAVAGLTFLEISGTVEVNGTQAIAIGLEVSTGSGPATRTVFGQQIATNFDVVAIVG